jgi:hypothetical protein
LDALADLGKSNSTKYIIPLEFTQLIKPFVQSSQTDAASSEAANASHPKDKMETEDIMNQDSEAGGSENKHFSSPNASTSSLPKARVIGEEDQKAA